MNLSSGISSLSITLESSIFKSVTTPSLYYLLLLLHFQYYLNLSLCFSNGVLSFHVFFLLKLSPLSLIDSTNVETMLA